MSNACLLQAREFLDGSSAFDDVLKEAQAEAALRAEGDAAKEQYLLPQILNEMIEELSLGSERKAKQLFYMVQAQNQLRSQVDEFVSAGKNPVKAVEEVLVTHYNGAYHTANNALISYHAEIDSLNLGRYIADENNHLNIVTEIAELNKTKGKRGITGDKDAQKVAEIYETHIQSARGVMLKLGVPISNLEGRIFKQVFSREVLVSIGKKEFVDDLLPRMDVYKTFGRQDVSRAEQLKYIQDYYDDVVSGHIGDLQPTAFDTQGMRKTYSKKQSEHRYLHLAKPEDVLHSVKKYTASSFSEIIDRSIKDVHFNKALVQSQGVNARFSFESLKKHASEKYSDNKVMQSPWLETIYKTGTNDWGGKYNPVAAEVQQLSISAARLIYLGGAGLSSVGDLGTLMLSSSRIGASGMGSIGRFMQLSFNNIKSLPIDDQRAILAGAEIQTAYAVGSFNELVTGASKLGGMAKGATYLTNVMFKYNGLHWITQKGKMAASLAHQSQMFHLSHKSWDELDKGFRFTLMRGGLNAKDWDIIRVNKDALKRDLMGNNFIDAYNIDTLPNSAFDSVVVRGAKENQYDVARDNLKQKLLSAVSSFADEAVPTSGVREKALMNLDTTPGTWGRAVTANMGNFLSYPITWMTKVAGRSIESANSPAAIAGIAGYMMATALFYGSVSDFLANANKGRTRDYGAMINGEFPPTDFVTSALLRGGFGGIAASLLHDYVLYDKGVSDFASPAAFGVADDVLMGFKDIMVDGFEGDYNSSLEKTISLVRNLAPLEFPVVGTVFDSMLYYPMLEMFAPDKLARMENNWRKRTGGEYFITPD